MIQKFLSLQRLKKQLANPFIRNLGWMGAAQFVNRFVRLGTTIIAARLLSPTDYGLAAVVLTTNEFIMVFTRSGIITKLIQAPQQDLEELCETAYWLTWLLCGGLFLFQCGMALPISWFYGYESIVLPICVMALVYLMLPFASIQAGLNMRENRLNVVAISEATQISVDCLLTAFFAWLGWGMWAIVLPKVLVAPIWVGVHRFNNSWRHQSKFTLNRWQEIVRYGRNILGIELLTTLRNNVDYLLVGRFLGITALGVYYFAFNAGLGISLSIINACGSALFPYLCVVNQDIEQLKQRFSYALRTIALVTIPIILLQSSLANFYVPLVFGEKWVEAGAIPVLVLVCLSALPRPFADAASQVLRAIDRPYVDLRWNVVFTILLVIAMLIGAQGSIVTVATAVLVTHVVALPLFTVWVGRWLLRLSAL